MTIKYIVSCVLAIFSFTFSYANIFDYIRDTKEEYYYMVEKNADDYIKDKYYMIGKSVGDYIKEKYYMIGKSVGDYIKEKYESGISKTTIEDYGETNKPLNYDLTKAVGDRNNLDKELKSRKDKVATSNGNSIDKAITDRENFRKELKDQKGKVKTNPNLETDHNFVKDKKDNPDVSFKTNSLVKHDVNDEL